MNFNVFVNQASIRDRRLIADFSFVSRPLLEVGVNSEGACNRVNTVTIYQNKPDYGVLPRFFLNHYFMESQSGHKDGLFFSSFHSE